MNKQNFEAKDRFPLSTQALAFVQDMIMATAQLALIGGDNYILSGCTTTGNTVSDGILVINGEIMPFRGGTIVDTITIVEEKIPVSANGITFENARIKRYAKFATGIGSGYYPWADFRPLTSNRRLEEVKATIRYVDEEIAKIQSGNIPAGVIVMWSGEEAGIPSGWVLCDGRQLTNGTRVPDLRGRFIVGYNSTASSGYARIGPGDKNPDKYMESLTASQLPKHSHDFDDYFHFDDKDANMKDVATGSVVTKVGEGTRNGGSTADRMYYKTHATKETGEGQAIDLRPPYYVLAFIIKIDIQN